MEVQRELRYKNRCQQLEIQTSSSENYQTTQQSNFLHSFNPPPTKPHNSQPIKMQFTTVFALIASVAFVAAAPAGEQPPATANNSGQICKVDQKQACCKTESAGVLGGLLGGSCELNIRTFSLLATLIVEQYILIYCYSGSELRWSVRLLPSRRLGRSSKLTRLATIILMH